MAKAKGSTAEAAKDEPATATGAGLAAAITAVLQGDPKADADAFIRLVDDAAIGKPVDVAFATDLTKRLGVSPTDLMDLIGKTATMYRHRALGEELEAARREERAATVAETTRSPELREAIRAAQDELASLAEASRAAQRRAASLHADYTQATEARPPAEMFVELYELDGVRRPLAIFAGDNSAGRINYDFETVAGGEVRTVSDPARFDRNMAGFPGGPR